MLPLCEVLRELGRLGGGFGDGEVDAQPWPLSYEEVTFTCGKWLPI